MGNSSSSSKSKKKKADNKSNSKCKFKPKEAKENLPHQQTSQRTNFSNLFKPMEEDSKQKEREREENRKKKEIEDIKKMEEHKATGNNLFKDNKFKDAIKEYRKALGYQETTALYSNIARCFLNLNNAQECIEYCGSALSIDKSNIKAITMMGDASLILAETKLDTLYVEHAEQYFNKAIAACKEYQQESFIDTIQKKINESAEK